MKTVTAEDILRSAHSKTVVRIREKSPKMVNVVGARYEGSHVRRGASDFVRDMLERVGGKR